MFTDTVAAIYLIFNLVRLMMSLLVLESRSVVCMLIKDDKDKSF